MNILLDSFAYGLLFVVIGLCIYTVVFPITKSFLRRINTWVFRQRGLSVILTWGSLQYQLRFSRCFRNRSAIEISRYFSLIKLSDNQVKVITDDLFSDEHKHEDKELPHFAWRRTNGLFPSINKLLSYDVEYPLYFLKAIVPLSQAPYMEKYIILNTDWKKLVLGLLKQESLTLGLIQSQIKYLSCLDELTTEYRYDPVPEVIQAIIDHPKITPQVITTLCANRDSRIRESALASPKCTEEGRVVGALVGLAATE